MNERIDELKRIRELLLEGKFEEAKRIGDNVSNAKMSIDDVTAQGKDKAE